MMDYADYTAAGRGLNKLFVAELLALGTIIPVVGIFFALAALILTLVGLNEAAGAAEGYRTAFWIKVASIVIVVLSAFLPVVELVSDILSLAGAYFVCITTADLLEETGDCTTAAKGRFVWKLYLVCTVVMVVCGLLALIPGVVILAALVIIPAVIASIVAAIQYLIFLYRASAFLS